MTDDSASKKTYKQLVDFGLDKHGFYGLIYSSDNGANYKLLVGTQGRIFYPEDARNFWPYLKGFVSEQLASAISLDWNNIKNKPDVALRTDIPSLTDYAKTSEVDEVKATAESALSNAEKAQSTADANSKALADKADRSELPVVPTDLVHTAEMEQARADITKAVQAASEAVTLAKSASVTIDTSNIHQIKKPSEYSEGFSYELKNVNEIGLDRTNFHVSVQQGTQGLLTTVSLQGFARQKLEILDSDRPLTFERNGAGDTWHSWALMTTW